MLNIIFDLDETLINAVYLDDTNTISMKTSNKYTEVFLITTSKKIIIL